MPLRCFHIFQYLHHPNLNNVFFGKYVYVVECLLQILLHFGFRNLHSATQWQYFDAMFFKNIHSQSQLTSTLICFELMLSNFVKLSTKALINRKAALFSGHPNLTANLLVWCDGYYTRGEQSLVLGKRAFRPAVAINWVHSAATTLHKCFFAPRLAGPGPRQ